MHTHAGDEDVQPSNKHTSDASKKLLATSCGCCSCPENGWQEKKRKEKATPLSISSVKSQILYQAAHEQLTTHVKVQSEQNSASAATAAILGAAEGTSQGAIF